MSKGLEIMETVDMVVLFVSAILFFGSWFFNGTKSSMTVGCGLVMFATMFIWFFIEAFILLVCNLTDIK